MLQKAELVHAASYLVADVTSFYVCVDDWRCDQYKWRQNGHKAIPSKGPKFKKYYFIAVANTMQVVTTVAFKRSYFTYQKTKTCFSFNIIIYW